MTPGPFSRLSALSQLIRSPEADDRHWRRPGTEEAIACECS